MAAVRWGTVTDWATGMATVVLPEGGGIPCTAVARCRLGATICDRACSGARQNLGVRPLSKGPGWQWSPLQGQC